jgi:spore coat polysaccharide biosynthesis protein SpsF
MITAVVVQARMKSTRLPGKVMMDLGGQSVLTHVMERCLRIKNADVVCCALPKGSENDKAAEVAQKTGAEIFRGSEDDLIDRYYHAATAIKADVVMRVTSDCPLIDPQVCADVIDLRQREGVDYACNNMPVAWPHGLDCEVFSYDLLEKSLTEEKRPWARGHVSVWMRENESVTRASLPGPGGDIVSQRWTIDYQEDIEFIRSLIEKFPAGDKLLQYAEIEAIISRYPELLTINEKYAEDLRNTEEQPEHEKIRNFHKSNSLTAC